MAETEFEWPCPRHEAHGAHSIDTDMSDPEQTCPGVKAHPLTQIGKGDLKETPSK